MDLPSQGRAVWVRWYFLPDAAPFASGAYGYTSSIWDEFHDEFPGYGEWGSYPLLWVDGSPPPWPQPDKLGGTLDSGSADLVWAGEAEAPGGTEEGGYALLQPGTSIVADGGTVEDSAADLVFGSAVAGSGGTVEDSGAVLEHGGTLAGSGGTVEDSAAALGHGSKLAGSGGTVEDSAAALGHGSRLAGSGGTVEDSAAALKHGSKLAGSGGTVEDSAAVLSHGSQIGGGGGSSDSNKGTWQRNETKALQRSGSSISALNPALTLPGDVGDLFVLVISALGSGGIPTFTVSDDQGNSWASRKITNNGGLSATVQIWSAVATTTGAPTLTVTPSRSSTVSTVLARYLPPKTTIAADVTNGQTITSNAAAGTLSATSSAAGDLWVAAVGTSTLGATAQPTISSGWSGVGWKGGGANLRTVAAADFGTGQTVASGTSKSNTFTFAVSVNAETAIVAFKAT